MLPAQTEAFLADYLGSEHFLFVDPGLKESAESVLRAFFSSAANRGAGTLEALTVKAAEAVLMQDLGRLDLPAAAKRAVPDLLGGFFGYLHDTGRYPAAGAWRECVEAAAPRFCRALRDDGSVRGQTFKKQYTDVGRNDPCPCGSGRKFKKCCGPLLGV